MKVLISNQIIIKEPLQYVYDYAEEELKIKNPEYEKRKRMGLWLKGIPKELDLYKTNGNIIIFPVGAFSKIKALINADAESIEIDLNDHAKYNFGDNLIPLYEYQQKAVTEMCKRGYGILQSAAGSGKTQMGLAIICSLGYKALWLTHTTDLLNQSYNRAKMYLPESILGKITDGKIAIGSGITFATVQTLAKQDLSQFASEFNIVVVDECHRAGGTITKATQFSKVINSIKARHKFGLSATVHRGDGTIKTCFAMLGNIGYIVSDYEVKEKIMPVRVAKIPLDTKQSDVYLDGVGQLVYTDLVNYLCSDYDRNNSIAKDLLENSEHYCLILSDRINHLEMLKAYINIDDCALISGKTNKKEREQAIDDLKNGRKHFLFATYSLAKEGLDIPRLDRLFLVTPHSDYAVIVQAVGRIARTFEGKEDAICYDYVDKNIGYAERCFKKRCTHYKKARCQL